ncbi:hypothetical protein [Tenacibaculum maritimum]|uniref:hypothetical protein n=2 Tax=Tenacibaculum maritimum TaxID=107401 RepID=UPI0010A52298|nr:hypothetical protein [Tenacibaculum maritimum]QCD61316.1 hypothetical protein B9C57_01595 [Tenacibaculum maritimum]CAA0209553.1 hypothetical protein UCDSB2_290001 [Tenacibaculum maritimum]
MSKELELLQTELNNSFPELIKLERNILVPQPEPFSTSYDLLLKNEIRSCTISLFGNEKSYRYIFEWDNCSIFEIFSNDVKRLGKIILDWVLKKSMPSKMTNQFPEIQFGLLAEYYEKGEGIKGEFIESWNSIEEFYCSFSDSWISNGKDALRLIKKMRKLGLDAKLRAGQSLWSFILSRSRRHGLKEDASHVEITFLGDNKMSIKSNLNEKKTSLESKVEYGEYLQGQIKYLLKEKIE